MKKENETRSNKIGILSACVALTLAVCFCAGLILNSGSAKAPAVTTVSETKPVYAALSPVTTAEDDVPVPSFAQSGKYTRAEVVQKCAPSVVGIDITYTVTSNPGYYGFGFGFGFGYGNDGGTREAKGSGSGVIVTSDGYIATCAHVVEEANTIQVTLNDETSYPATLVGTDAKNDIAIIKIEAEGLVPAQIGNSDAIVIGEDAIVIGNPMGELIGTVTAGIISTTKRTITVEGNEMQLIQTDAAVNSGNSGGGLFNANGELIGIVNAKVSSSGVEGLGFAIPVNSVSKQIGDLLSFGYVTGRAYLGVYTQNVTMRQDGGNWGYSTGRKCVQIVDVIKGSAAEKAGLQTGDIILKVNDKEIGTNTELSDLIAGYNAGDKATMTIQRSGEQIEVEVVFGEYVPQETVQEQ